MSWASLGVVTTTVLGSVLSAPSNQVTLPPFLWTPQNMAARERVRPLSPISLDGDYALTKGTTHTCPEDSEAHPICLLMGSSHPRLPAVPAWLAMGLRCREKSGWCETVLALGEI